MRSTSTRSDAILGSNPQKQMKDDKKYIALMDTYKQKRLRDPQGAQKYLEAAMKLSAEGEVSDDAHIGAAYL